MEEHNLTLLQTNAALKEEISRCRRAEKVLLATKERLKRLLASSPVAIYSSQPIGDYGITFVSESISKLGYEPRQFLESSGFWAKCIHPEDVSRVFRELLNLPQDEHQISEYRFLHQNGSYRWIQDQRQLIRDESGNILEIVGSWQDITERKEMEEALFQEKELAQVTLQSIGDAVITTNAEGKIDYLNPVAAKITGWKFEEAKGLLLSEVFQTINEITHEPAENLVTQVLQEGKVVEVADHILLIARNGHEYAIDESAAPIRDYDGQIIGTVLVFRDVTKPRNLARQLSWQASHDELTKLINRRGFEEKLIEAIADAKDKKQQHMLCYLDLDQFKIVNDTCGHIAGDELLRQISGLLHDSVRSTDTLARLGGDEFGIILNQCPLEAAKNITENIRQVIQNFRFVWQDKTFTVGISIGLVPIDIDSDNWNSLLSAADAACYVAKDRGRNRVHLSQVDDLQLVQKREERQWITRIDKALEENRFCLYYQAITSINKLTHSDEEHYEILLRMIDESGEIVSPMAFIPTAERYNLMPELDRWVIRNFFASYQDYSTNNLRHNTSNNCLYTINLSGTSINDKQFIDFLKEQFTLYQISPEIVCFEISENVAITNLNKTLQFIQELRKLGCRFALDDFGSGMSSFAYLHNLPIDYLKIDSHFIKNITTNSINDAMVECINRIGHVIGIKTIAKFVENEAILTKLQELGVDYVQGYGIAQPSQLLFSN